MRLLEPLSGIKTAQGHALVHLIFFISILLIQFEDFVLKNENFLGKLCNHMSISSKISSNYKADFSKKNIGKFHQLLDKNELQIIESNLGEYIYGAK